MNTILPYRRAHFRNTFSNPLSTEFDGTNEYVAYGAMSGLLGAAEGSVSMWVKVLAYSATAGARIFSDAGGYFYLEQVGAGIDGYKFTLYDVSVRSTGAFFMSLNTWYHIACCYKSDATSLHVYKNGVVQTVGSVMGANIGDISNAFRMGGPSIAGYQTNIRVNLWETWNVKLTAPQCLELYNGGIPINPALSTMSANLTHAYRSGNGDTYATITDRVGSVNGTMTNMEAGDFVTDAP